MMHSQMPVRSLLCALLMLPLGMPQGVSYMPIPRAMVPILAAFAVKEYNKDRNDSRTYFKIVEILYTKSPVDDPNEYYFNARLAKTGCLKKPGTTMAYRKIQQCREFQGIPQVICHFIITSYHGDTMSLDDKVCDDSV
ncbi:cystatin-1-like [Crotalus tigris]|uniref:cystatin-1-like n=1 Tax=Crotalus tigris TaxID=88082 RepID=UPI00192F5A54|nr:cystatin-1-like [Crotalus tigris]